MKREVREMLRINEEQRNSAHMGGESLLPRTPRHDSVAAPRNSELVH